MLRKLGLQPASNAVTLRKYLVKYSIDTSHFNPLLNRPQSRNGSTKIPLTQILIRDSSYASNSGLKNRLVKEGVLKYCCTKCKNRGRWKNNSLVLQLEHRNGIHTDNRIENLELLCPNCHSQTNTYAGRNKSK